QRAVHERVRAGDPHRPHARVSQQLPRGDRRTAIPRRQGERGACSPISSPPSSRSASRSYARKAEAESVELPDDVAMYIASSIKSNVRELEGALIRLAAYASLSKRHIDLEFAQE